MTSAANPDAYGPTGWNQSQNNASWGSGPWGSNPWGKGPSGNGPWSNGAWGNGAWGNGPGGQSHQPDNAGPGWGNPTWAVPPFWRPYGINRPAAIAFTVLGFLFWWPVGLALLIYMIGSGRMGCYGSGRRAMRRAMKEQFWHQAGPWAQWKAWARGSSDRPAPSSGNRAFDEYKAETLRRMEEEQKDFSGFLERLRFAKDKAEFDAFMTERRSRPPVPPENEPPKAD